MKGLAADGLTPRHPAGRRDRERQRMLRDRCRSLLDAWDGNANLSRNAKRQDIPLGSGVCSLLRLGDEHAELAKADRRRVEQHADLPAGQPGRGKCARQRLGGTEVGLCRL